MGGSKLVEIRLELTKQLIIEVSLKCMCVLKAAVTTSRCPPFLSPLRGSVDIAMAIHLVALLFQIGVHVLASPLSGFLVCALY